MQHEVYFSSVSAALNAIGMGPVQWWLLVFCGCAWACDAFEAMLLSYLGPSVKCAWAEEVTPALESALSSVVFLGMLVGVYCFGLFADAFGRRKGFLVSIILLGVAGFSSAVAPSFIWLIIFRMVVGVALGGTPIALTLFSECVPSARRGMLVLALQSAWTIGTMAVALLAWAVLPKAGWRWLLALSAVPSLILLAGYFWLPESPMWLFVKDRYGEAEKVVTRLAAAKSIQNPIKLRLSHERMQRSLENATSSSSPKRGRFKAFWAHMRGSIKEVFAGDMFFTTIVLLFIWFVNSMVYYGLVLLTTAMHSGTTEDGEECTEDGRPTFSNWDYLSVVITSLAEAPGILVAALLIDSSGRLISIRVGLIVCSGCLVGLIFATSGAKVLRLILLFGSRAAIECTFSTLYVFTPELFATPVRSFGLALCNSFSRIGGFMAPFATVFLVEDGRPRIAALVLGVLCFVASVASFFLPKETQGVDLDNLGSSDSSGADDIAHGEEEELQVVGHRDSFADANGTHLSTEQVNKEDRRSRDANDEKQPLVGSQMKSM